MCGASGVFSAVKRLFGAASGLFGSSSWSFGAFTNSFGAAGIFYRSKKPLKARKLFSGFLLT